MMFFKVLCLFSLIFIHSKLFAKDGSAIALIYHRFENNQYPSTSISKKTFYEQLLYLKENNFNVLPISTLVEFFYNEKPLPKKSVFITVDDAYKSFYEHAFPILKKFNFPFSIFLSTNFVTENEKSDFVSWEMLREMRKYKGDIFNHSHSHNSFVKFSLEEIRNDVLLAEKILDEKLGKIRRVISYPYGESNKIIEGLIQKLGYKIAFSQHSSPIHFKENKYNLPRFSINEEYGELKRFKQIVNLKPLVLNFFEISKNNKNNTSLDITFASKLNNKNINCFVNDGILTKEIKENLIKIKLTELNENKRYRLNCTLFQNNQLHWFGKMIIRENDKFTF